MSARSWTSTSQSRCACLWSCPWEPPPAGPTAIIAGPNGWRHSRSCSAMQTLLMEAAHWGLALIPVLVLLAVFAWLDAFELMNFKEILGPAATRRDRGLLSWPVSGRLLDTLPIGFSNYSRFVAPWIEEAIKGAMIVGALPHEPHRLQARRGHRRFRDRRWFFGRREHHLPGALPRLWHRHLAGARLRHRRDAWRDARDPCGDRS